VIKINAVVKTDPTLPRYGTDRPQPRILTFEAQPVWFNETGLPE